MFVRTKKGKIFDCYVSEQMGKPIYYSKNSKTNGYIDWNEVYKKSENIIDILEVGDYVNGKKVIDTSSSYYKLVFETINPDIKNGLRNDYINYYKDIKSIVTKEQFESMEYKVGE